jgi:RimJ/RimL family protein N-acetyltransferase
MVIAPASFHMRWNSHGGADPVCSGSCASRRRTHYIVRPMEPILIDLPSELSTQRLLLRVPRAGDGQRVNDAIVDSAAELTRWMPWANPLPTVEQSEIWCRQAAVKFLARQQIHFSLYAKDEPDVCSGCIGLHHIDWHVPTAETGYWIRTSRAGRGFGTEALTAVTAFALDIIKVKRLQLRCDVKNPRSAALAERCGFALEGTMRCDCRDNQGELRDTRLYARIAT